MRQWVVNIITGLLICRHVFKAMIPWNVPKLTRTHLCPPPVAHLWPPVAHLRPPVAHLWPHRRWVWRWIWDSYLSSSLTVWKINFFLLPSTYLHFDSFAKPFPSIHETWQFITSILRGTATLEGSSFNIRGTNLKNSPFFWI